MFECLMEHGCTNLTSTIDPHRFSSGLINGGSFGDIWKGKFYDGTDLAIKVWRFTSIVEDGDKSLKVCRSHEPAGQLNIDVGLLGREQCVSSTTGQK